MRDYTTALNALVFGLRMLNIDGSHGLDCVCGFSARTPPIRSKGAMQFVCLIRPFDGPMLGKQLNLYRIASKKHVVISREVCDRISPCNLSWIARLEIFELDQRGASPPFLMREICRYCGSAVTGDAPQNHDQDPVKTKAEPYCPVTFHVAPFHRLRLRCDRQQASYQSVQWTGDMEFNDFRCLRVLCDWGDG